MKDLRRIHREVANLYPDIKQIRSTLGRTKRRNESLSPDVIEAARIEETINDLMAACADALTAGQAR